jgi:hypothetical protein
MNIYALTFVQSVMIGDVKEITIHAKDENSAREIAANETNDQDWKDTNMVKCINLGNSETIVEITKQR